MLGLLHLTGNPPGSFNGNVTWFTQTHPEYAPHRLWDYFDGVEQEAVFVADPYAPSKALVNLPGGVETNNRQGGLFQVEIVGDRDLCELYPEEWYAALRSYLLGISQEFGIIWKFQHGTQRLSFSEWTDLGLVGWYQHIHVPENDHTDCRGLNLAMIEYLEKGSDMPEYVLRYKQFLNEYPWLAIYANASIRRLGGVEFNYIATRYAIENNGKPIDTVDETDLAAYKRAMKQADPDFVYPV
jgi:hypothetical protein